MEEGMEKGVDPAGEVADEASPNDALGTHGYPTDTAGYPDDDFDEGDHEVGGSGDREPAPSANIDLERFLDPRDAARQLTSDQPVAHDGKAGWAVERSTGRGIWLGGEMQWDVMNRLPGAPRDEPGLTDVPAHGGLPAPAPPDAEIRLEAEGERCKRVQIGLKLTPEQALELESAAAVFGVSRTTLARLLVVRGAREIVGRATD